MLSPPGSVLRPPSSVLRVHGALFAVNLLFAINYIVSKLGMSSFDPFTFAYLRVVGAAIVLNLFVASASAPLGMAAAAPPRDARRVPAGWRDASATARVALYSLLGVVINQTMFLAGLA